MIPEDMATKRVIKRRVPVTGTPQKAETKPEPKPKVPSQKKEAKKAPSNKMVKAKTSKKKTSKKVAPITPPKKEMVKKPAKDQTHHKKKEEKKDDHNTSEKAWWYVVAAVVLAVAIGLAVASTKAPDEVLPSPKPEPLTYKPSDFQTWMDLYHKMEELDKEYVTSLHDERLGKDMINPIFVKPYVNKVDEMWAAVNESGSNETKIMNDFLEARRRMLISQLYFQQALKYGQRGVVTETFNCKYKGDLEAATLLYNQSYEIGRIAIPRLDHVLTESEEARMNLGLNTEKMRWYVTTFGDIKRVVETNLWAINTFCVKRESLNNSVEYMTQKDGDLDISLPGASSY